MRDLLFKNLTSTDKSKRIIVSQEVSENEGVRTQITRHLICMIKEIKNPTEAEKPLPYLSVVKEKNNKEQRERFAFRLKGGLYTVAQKHLYLITFLHSLKINIKVLAEPAVEI